MRMNYLENIVVASCDLESGKLQTWHNWLNFYTKLKKIYEK